MSELCTIVDVINEKIPQHGRGLIDPERILQERRANCFGKVALTGAALLSSGIPEGALRLMLCENHGTEFSDSRYWLGHVELAVLPDQMLVDGMNILDVVDLQSRFEQATLEPGDVAIDMAHVAARKPTAGYTKQQLVDLQELVGPPVVHGLAHLFRVYGFGEGLAAYQTHHPDLAQSLQYTAEDYARCYAQLAA